MRLLLYAGITITILILLLFLKGCNPTKQENPEALPYTEVPRVLAKNECYQIKYVGIEKFLQTTQRIYCEEIKCCITKTNPEAMCGLAECINKKELDKYNEEQNKKR